MRKLLIEETPMTAAELHLMRTSLGWTITDMADFLDVGERTIRRWESPTRPELPNGRIASELSQIAPMIEHTAKLIADAWADHDDHGIDSFQWMPGDEVPGFVGHVKAPVYRNACARAHDLYGVRFAHPAEGTL